MTKPNCYQIIYCGPNDEDQVSTHATKSTIAYTAADALTQFNVWRRQYNEYNESVEEAHRVSEARGIRPCPGCVKCREIP